MRATQSERVPIPTPTPTPQLRADIVILDWNRPELTIRAIESALGQTGVERRIVVIDQASTAQNRARVADFCRSQPDVLLHSLPRNVGVAAGRNIATRFCDAPFLISLDNDAVFADDECVLRATRRLLEHPALGALAFRIVDAETGEERTYWDYPLEFLDSPVESFEVTRFLGGGHALRREAFERAGGYDESLFFGGEERDVAWRMIKHGYRLRFCRDLAVLHRHTPQSKLGWSDQRYYFLVRNSLYINHKFGAGAPGFARGGLSFLLRGLRNGLGRAALRGIASGFGMSLRFSLDPQDKADYRLPPLVHRYIAETDLKPTETILQKLRRQWTALPAV
jgi:GT2 family glycosyltransferase